MKNSSIRWFASLVIGLIAWPFAHAQTIDVHRPFPDLVETMAACQHRPQGPELSVESLTLDVGRTVRRRVTRAAAAADVDRFFHLLEHGYCGYGFFSRENDFSAAREDILAGLRARENWPTHDLAELIRRHLGFVTDCHLKLGHVQFAGHQDFWAVPDLDLTERDGRLCIANDEKGPVIESVNGRAPEEFVFRSLDAAGLSAQVLGTLSTTEPRPLHVVTRTDGVTSEHRYRLTRSPYNRWDLFRFFRLGGIPVVRMATFSDHHVEEIEHFLSTADSLRGEPCVIVDLRGNGGGNTRWAKEWIRRFTGQTPQLHQLLTELVSRTSLVGQANYFVWLAAGPGRAISDQLADQRARLADRISDFDESGGLPYWRDPYILDRRPIPNESTLVVVTDAAVASAGEGFLSYLHDQVENVVLVGENTRGALIFGHMTAHRLPGSGLLAFLPVKLNLPLDMKMREGRGYDPDYWVPAAAALNHAVAAIRAGTIPTAQPLPPAVLATEFAPESPPRLSRGQLRRTLQLVTVILAGIVFGVANRRRGPVLFALSAAVLVTAGIIGFAGNLPARWIALLGGVGHGIVAGAKLWKAKRPSIPPGTGTNLPG